MTVIPIMTQDISNIMHILFIIMINGEKSGRKITKSAFHSPLLFPLNIVMHQHVCALIILN